ncbi:fibroblast growth factor receptor 2, partial [Paragonimus westermani]
NFILLFVNVLYAEHCKLSLAKIDEYTRNYQTFPVEIILHCGVHDPKRCQMGSVRINWSLNGDLIRNKNAQFEMRIVVDRQSPTKTRYQCVMQNAVEAVSRVFTIRSNGRLKINPRHAKCVLEIQDLEEPGKGKMLSVNGHLESTFSISDTFTWLLDMPTQHMIRRHHFEHETVKLSCLFHVQSEWLRPKVEWFFITNKDELLRNSKIRRSLLQTISNNVIAPRITNSTFGEPVSALQYRAFNVNKEMEGGYLCIGGLTGVERMRWKSMHLQVRSCREVEDSNGMKRLSNLETYPRNIVFSLLGSLVLFMILFIISLKFCRSKISTNSQLDSKQIKMSDSIQAITCQRPVRKVHVFRHPNQLYTKSHLTDVSQNGKFNSPDFKVRSDEGYNSQTDLNTDESVSSGGIYSRRQQTKRMLAKLPKLILDGLETTQSTTISSSNEHIPKKQHPLTDDEWTDYFRTTSSIDPAFRFFWSPNATTEINESGKKEIFIKCESPAIQYELPLDKDWELPRECLRIGCRLGEGAFGVVYYGQVFLDRVSVEQKKRFVTNPAADGCLTENKAFYNICPVAVKMLRTNFIEQDLMDLVRETEMMKVFGQHPHLIKLYGACTQSGPLQIVVEYAPYGNLRDFLRARRQPANNLEAIKLAKLPHPYLSKLNLLEYGLQIALGMDYLASRSVVHRDLAARNILIGERFVVKIADFGLTRSVSDYYKKTTTMEQKNSVLSGTRSKPFDPIRLECLSEAVYQSNGWRQNPCLIEFTQQRVMCELNFHQFCSIIIRIWSFGVLLWEIFTLGSVPYPSIAPERLLPMLQDGYRNECPPLANEDVYQLMLRCWSQVPDERPEFCDIVSYLEIRKQSSPEWLSDTPINMPNNVPGSKSSQTNGTTFICSNNTVSKSSGRYGLSQNVKHSLGPPSGECNPHCQPQGVIHFSQQYPQNSRNTKNSTQASCSVCFFNPIVAQTMAFGNISIC